jgi:hypothetical protein
MKAILISGKAEAGKDSVANILRVRLAELQKRSVRLAYGDYVKDTARELWDWDGKKDEKGRELLQWWGTEYVRTRFPDFWAETVVCLAHVVRESFDFMLIPDLRFLNEIEIWTDNNFDIITVRVERPGHDNKLTPEQRLHISETALDKYVFDVTLTATNMEELTAEVYNKLLPKIL